MNNSTKSLVLIMSFVFQSTWADSDVVDDSLANSKQILRLNKYLMNIPSNDPKVNARELNKQLKEAGLPAIDVDSPSFKVDLSRMVGFASSEIVGAAFYDGKHKFCLPCTVGHNNFEWGIVPFKINAPNRDGDYYSYLNCLESVPYSTTNVSGQRSTPTRFVAVPGYAEGAKGFYIYIDDKVYFYKSELPQLGENFQSYLVTLPDGVKTAIGLKVPYDPNRASLKISELQSFESNLSSARADGVPDLGIGRGDKKTPEAHQTLQKAVLNQYENILKLDGFMRKSVENSSVCQSIVTCESVKPLDGTKVDLSRYKSEFNCGDSSRQDGTSGRGTSAGIAN